MARVVSGTPIRAGLPHPVWGCPVKATATGGSGRVAGMAAEYGFPGMRTVVLSGNAAGRVVVVARPGGVASMGMPGLDAYQRMQPLAKTQAQCQSQHQATHDGFHSQVQASSPQESR